MDQRKWGNVELRLIPSFYSRYRHKYLDIRWHFDNIFSLARPVKRKKKTKLIDWFLSNVTVLSEGSRHFRSF